MFTNKTLVITGGTGSFGNAVLKRFAHSEIKEIRIFSRDEKKQDDLRKSYLNPKIKFYIGDVRDRASLSHVMKGADFVFHAAALKQVPSCEFYPMQAVLTNVMGTQNVLDAAIEAGVEKILCLSTDKAVYPINAMGISKAMMEKVIVATGRNLALTEGAATTVCCTRYGNVMASRGSVIPVFVDSIKKGLPISITEPTMTRFMMSLEDAVDLVLFAFANGENGDIFVQKAPAATIETLAHALVRILSDRKEHPIKLMGSRHGEKLHETLLSREEMLSAKDLGNYFRVPMDGRDLNYSAYVEQGAHGAGDSDAVEDYNSSNTSRLNIEELTALLMKLDFMKEQLAYETQSS